MNECIYCKTKVDPKVKIKLWCLVSQKCNNCDKPLKLDKDPLFRITLLATIITVVLMVALYNQGVNMFLSAFIAFVLGVSMAIVFIIRFVGFID